MDLGLRSACYDSVLNGNQVKMFPVTEQHNMPDLDCDDLSCKT